MHPTLAWARLSLCLREYELLGPDLVEGGSDLHHNVPDDVVARGLLLADAISWIRIICQNIFRRQQAVRRVGDPIDATLPSNPEKTVALRKLVEAKDCTVRAVLFKDGHKCRQDWLPNVDTATNCP